MAITKKTIPATKPVRADDYADLLTTPAAAPTPEPVAPSPPTAPPAPTHDVPALVAAISAEVRAKVHPGALDVIRRGLNTVDAFANEAVVRARAFEKVVGHAVETVADEAAVVEAWAKALANGFRE